MEPALPPERPHVKLVVGAFVVAYVIAAVTYAPGKRTYKMVDAALANPRAHEPIRVRGYVKPGTLQRQDASANRLTLTSHGACLDTELLTPLPDTVRDNSEIVVDGRLEQQADGRWVLIGTQLWARCAIKYDGVRAGVDTEFK